MIVGKFSLLAPSTYKERLTRIRVIEIFGGRPYVPSCANMAANMGVTPKQIRHDGFTASRVIFKKKVENIKCVELLDTSDPMMPGK